MNSIILLSCFFCLGSSAWVLVNAIYAEIPLIVAALDYDYAVISKLTLCITMTSVAPILWTMVLSEQHSSSSSSLCCCCCCCHHSHHCHNNNNNSNDKSVTKVGIGIMLTLGTVTALSMALNHAALQPTAILITSVCGGLVGTMSNVLYYPHAASTAMSNGTATTTTSQSGGGEDAESPSLQFSPAIRQTTAMASGMTTASLFLAVLALIQQKQQQPNGSISNAFSIQAYFGVVVAVFVLAIIGFVGTLIADQSSSVTISNLINGTPMREENDLRLEIHNCDDVAAAHDNINNYGTIEISNNKLRRRQSTNASNNAYSSKVSVEELQDTDTTQPTTISTSLEIQEESPPPSTEDHNHLHFLSNNNIIIHPSSYWTSFCIVSKRHATINAGQFWLNLGTFFLPGIVPYSIQNFDNSQQALHYLTVTQLIAQTLGTVVSGWKQSRSVWTQLIVFGILWIPTVILSFVNNTNFQHSSQLHSALPITLNALLNFGYGYSSTIFYHLVHADEEQAAATATTATAAASQDANASTVEFITVLRQDVGDDMDHSPHHDPHIASRVLGSWRQLGAMIGSLIAYFLVVNGAIS